MIDKYSEVTGEELARINGGRSMYRKPELTAQADAKDTAATDPSSAYGGQGIARRLVEKVIEEARARQIKILPLCSYASKMMEGKTEYQDVLVIR